jgi:hypothetical protein
MSIYDEMKRHGVEIDNHESDLYVPVNKVTELIVGAYPFKCNVKKFKSNVDGKMWYDIPFAFEPFWAAKTANKRSV